MIVIIPAAALFLFFICLRKFIGDLFALLISLVVFFVLLIAAYLLIECATGTFKNEIRRQYERVGYV